MITTKERIAQICEDNADLELIASDCCYICPTCRQIISGEVWVHPINHTQGICRRCYEELQEENLRENESGDVLNKKGVCSDEDA